jgi:hypothetical protein
MLSWNMRLCEFRTGGAQVNLEVNLEVDLCFPSVHRPLRRNNPVRADLISCDPRMSLRLCGLLLWQRYAGAPYLVPRTLCSAISAFTRVFDALCLRGVVRC